MEEYACSFSGHRALSASVREALLPLLDETIETLFGEGYRTFYCGGALGFDSLAADRVILFRAHHPEVSLSLLLPCRDQHIHWNREQKEEYDRILRAADEVSYVADHYDDSCMKKRNDRLALFCDTLVCYVTHTGSGSSQTLRVAQKNQRRVINLAERLPGLPG